jgi:hypothetical protein
MGFVAQARERRPAAVFQRLNGAAFGGVHDVRADFARLARENRRMVYPVDAQ